MIFASAYDKSRNNKGYLFAVLLLMVLFAGLRSSEVGTDAGGYARRFMLDSRMLAGDFEAQIQSEPGFYYLNQFLRTISNNYWILFTGIALLTYSCVLRSIRFENGKLLIPLVVFITLGYYTFVFNAARQGIAVGIYMLSFRYLFADFRKGFPKYCFFVVLAALFHKTVIIAIPLYFVFRQKYSVKVLILTVFLGIGITALLPAFFSYAETLESRYRIYSTGARGGEMLAVFYVLISLFFIFWRKNVDPQFSRKYDYFLNMTLLGTLVYVIVQLSDIYVEMTRFAAYFQVAIIFLWGYIYQSKHRPSPIFSIFIVMGHLIFFYIFCTKMASLVPYTFNPEVF